MNTGRAKSSMNNKQQNVTLREAKKMFGLWDNVYHQNAVKNLDPTARWDPTKMAQERKKKVEKENEESSEEETDGKKNTNILFWVKTIYHIIFSINNSSIGQFP